METIIFKAEKKKQRQQTKQFLPKLNYFLFLWAVQYPSRWSILHHTNDMVEPAQRLDIKSLHNVHVIEELIQLTVIPNAEIIANLHWIEDLM